MSEYSHGKGQSAERTNAQQYDEITDIMHRIDHRINKGNERRKKEINDRKSMLSRKNNHVDDMNRKWNVSCEERVRQSLANVVEND